jgi:hypothetical protein
MEMSLVTIYEGESLIEEMIAFTREFGYVPYWAVPGYRDPGSMQLYQMDLVFFRPKANP